MTQPEPTDPRALIKAATPLPWTHGRTHWRRQQSDWWGIFAPASGRLPMLSMPPKAVAYLEDERIDHADAALVVYAVNNLPALLDVAEALERLLDDLWRYSFEYSYDEGVQSAEDAAREALDRLKESTHD